MAGKVYLVGGGPGAIDLYTIKAMACIKEADCIVYDRLIDPRILTYTKENCEHIYVGKASNQHTLSQDKINLLLVEKAHQYQKVVRLKGGDVYVFGRGGEEALVLLEHNIHFEVVPGLSSSIAGLCYAGIPITHRGLATGFEVVTAHHKNNSEYKWDYERFLNDQMTYVFMMGLSELETITSELLKVGKSSDTPMALISNATLPNQKALYGNLGTIVDLFRQSDLVSPMLIVMGQVVSLHQQLDFFSKKTFKNKKILVTTLTAQTHELTNFFQEEGAITTQLQVGTIKAIDFTMDFDWQDKLIVFTSRNGIRSFFHGLYEKEIDFRSLSHVRFACIGNKTADELHNYGFISDIIGEHANSIDFNPLLRESLYNDERMVIVCSEDSCAIEKINEDDILLPVYKNESLTNEIETIEYDIACFSCASSVERVAQMNIKFKKALSIGPITSTAIKHLYPKVEIIEADEASYEGMIKKIGENSHVF